MHPNHSAPIVPTGVRFNPPEFPDGEVGEMLRRSFGITGQLIPLPGERDQNFKVAAGDQENYVVKISDADEERDAIDFIVRVLQHLEAVAPELPVPRVVLSVDGEPLVEHLFSTGAVHAVQLITYLDGRPLSQAPPRDPSVLRDIGRLQGQTCHALSSFFHPAAKRFMPWDITNNLVFDDALFHRLPSGVRQMLSPHTERLRTETLPALRRMRAQTIHGDCNANNVLCSDVGCVSGLIDFGDALHSPVMQELAVSAASFLEIYGEANNVVEALTDGFKSCFPLLPEELDLLNDAILLRLILTVEILSGPAERHPTSEQPEDEVAPTIKVLQRFLEHHSASGKRIAPMAPSTEERRSPTTKLQMRRTAALSPSYKLFYDEPLHLVRGRGVSVFDADGRAYLDCYNNVPSVGHCHPHVVAALSQQAATLNTHTRYIDEHIITYAERLAGTMPAELDTCIFVCTGTEANDLAYRIAQAVTGNRGAIVSEDSYHGNSMAVAELSLYDKHASQRPTYIEAIAAPDTYRGLYRAGESGIGSKYAVLVDQAIEDLNQSGYGTAMLMVDSIFDSQGIFTAPRGYYSNLFQRIHQAGGLVVADEVQSGLCRLGDHMWGFEDSNVVPDVVTMGKPMGDGHPLGVLVTRREIMGAFCERNNYFNTFGGNPVSAAVGNAVLDVIETESILGRVHSVGTYLQAGLRGLAERFEAIGDIRGKGLFQGMDLVSDRATRVPDQAAAGRLENEMRRRGVLVATTGPHDNVIKIRPPLVFSQANADQLLDVMEAALRFI